MESYIKGLELGKRERFFYSPRFSRWAKIAGIGFVTLLLKEFYYESQLKDLLELKKERLSMPIYEVTNEDLVNPPWKGENYEKWKYRLVKLKGRQIHSKTFLVPMTMNQYKGFAYIVPVAVEEDSDLENQRGLLVNKGFLPYEFEKNENRLRMENGYKPVELIGYLDKAETLQKNIFQKRGNYFDEQRWICNNPNLKQMGSAINFVNKDGLSQAVVNVVDLKETPLDEKHPSHYKLDMSFTNEFPYPKTLSGALQNGENRLSSKFNTKIAYGIMAAICFLI